MAGIPLFQVDTFSERPFAGNPAAVCLLDHEPDIGWMQAVASELRMPATAFVIAGDGHPTLRWFSVTNELEICGHGTVAAAHVLWETKAIPPADDAVFATLSGEIAAAKDGSLIFLTLPVGTVERAEAPPHLLDAIGVPAQEVWRTPLDYLLVVETPAVVARLAPNLDPIRSIDTRGVIITSEGGDGVDFTSRFFAPSIGVPEDSVTGSAHASLTPFWAARLHKTELRARQASARSGVLELRLEGTDVRIGGRATTVSRGQLVV